MGAARMPGKAKGRLVCAALRCAVLRSAPHRTVLLSSTRRNEAKLNIITQFAATYEQGLFLPTNKEREEREREKW